MVNDFVGIEEDVSFGISIGNADEVFEIFLSLIDAKLLRANDSALFLP